MLPLTKILCPTDFSEHSYEGLKVGRELALHFAAQMWLIHVIPPIPVYGPFPDLPIGTTFNIPLYQQELVAYSENALREVVEKRLLPEVSAQILVAVGDAAPQIVRAARQENFDLIVIATHGQTGWRRFVFGSVAEKVVRLAPGPVLTVQMPREADS
jgi:nucleotide-binding universal stress UspA family protein